MILFLWCYFSFSWRYSLETGQTKGKATENKDIELKLDEIIDLLEKKDRDKME